MLPDNADDTVIFFGGKDYLLLFYKLTRGLKNKKVIFYNSKTITPFEGYFFNQFQTTTKTNWHYECVKAFLNDAIEIGHG